MKCVELALKNAYVIEMEPRSDERGTFCRLYCAQMLREQGIADHPLVQVNLSQNLAKGTLRGLHFQAAPFLEAKLVYCLQGAVFDAIVDLRPESPTFMKHFTLRLGAKNCLALYIPKGFAHGFLTLEDNSQLLYLMSEFYHQDCEKGYRYDDPAFKIPWPFAPMILSEKDKVHPSFRSCHVLN